ncbi:Probable aromatic acid decarboxylase [Acidilobus saccharovorans 345-15]|uniref:Flavin prenyltransferase UbiX n=1 Tax=Acidilobus saccharovorans (strain DSM 16705 / JCM 18335 / VKM B-2471 / 345-15) TaxID=666510 RepID=D9PZF1_ACIS3|nr:UbiX family flavin prenyltransferase [Acidilobus saccharovorans]ADL18439.1 Probable aromatic acid decarboxylase [Acidilobus saccharovorans 345-15]
MPCGTLSVAITGASGVRYGIRLLQAASELGLRLSGVIVTRSADLVAQAEEGMRAGELLELASRYSQTYSEDDMTSPLASSSSQPDCMAIVPASMKTVALIANGLELNLVARAALAMLRLRRPLVVAFREAPLGVAELRNLLSLAEMGAVVMPLAPGFYSKPRTVEDLVDFMVGKILDSLGVDNSLYLRWRGGRP